MKVKMELEIWILKIYKRKRQSVRIDMGFVK